jgi:hypothetical protein
MFRRRLSVDRLEVAELEDRSRRRFFFSFDGTHFIEVDRVVDPSNEEDLRRARDLWSPRFSALWFVGLVTDSRKGLEARGARIRPAKH